jgi:hypothetical protein
MQQDVSQEPTLGSTVLVRYIDSQGAPAEARGLVVAFQGTGETRRFEIALTPTPADEASTTQYLTCLRKDLTVVAPPPTRP